MRPYQWSSGKRAAYDYVGGHASRVSQTSLHGIPGSSSERIHTREAVLRSPGLLSSADGVPTCSRLLFLGFFRPLDSFTASLYTHMLYLTQIPSFFPLKTGALSLNGSGAFGEPQEKATETLRGAEEIEDGRCCR